MCSTRRSLAGSQYPAGIFNCRQIWSGAVQNYIPGVRLTGNLRISPAITKDGKLRIAKATVSTSQPDHVALSACLMPYTPYSNDNAGRLPDHRLAPVARARRPRSRRTLRQSAVRRRSLTTGAVRLLPYNSNQLPVNIANTTAARKATPSDVACNATPQPIIRDSSLYGSVEPMVAASAANGYTTTASGAQATVAGDITVNALKVDVLIGDQ